MKLNAACLQLTSNDQPKENLDQVIKFSEQAIQSGADFVLTPENTFLFTMDKKILEAKSETYEKGNCLNHIKKFVKSKKIWFLIGGTPVKEGKHIYNRSILLNPNGEIVSTYDKIHMFDVVLSKKEKYFESKSFYPGNKLKTFNLPWGKIGLSICYDLRFPSLYRKLAKAGSLFLTVPSAFTETTGKKHWHSLLRARAIENFCYIFAPAQGGIHYNGRKTFGHSLIISPNGEILKELKKSEGVITAAINPKLSKNLRLRIPSLKGD